MPAGDMLLRHDIQRLADYGVIKGPTTTWPLAWGPILADIRSHDPSKPVPRDVLDAIARVRARASWETRTEELYFNAGASAAERPTRIRSFENTPRGRAEIGAGVSYTGNWYTVALNAQALDVAKGEEEFRVDGSVIGVMAGNYSFTVNTLDRWWGPGWDGSLILSNDARPMPAISIDRNFTKPFNTKFLSWLGPWDISAHFGALESERFVPNAQFFGLRFNFRPIPSLEIGVSRTAQWCGDDRPCNLDTFIDLLFGRDNIGEDNIDESNEPGNQLAGFDLRWSTRILNVPIALYGQFIGEDEAGGLPSRYLAQVGIEGTGLWRDNWAYRWFGEYADTKCRFYESDVFFNCAYNNSIYQTGYRYRGRSIGHGADNDARLASFGLIAANEKDTEWSAIFRIGKLNRDGIPDPRNTVTPSAQDIISIDLRHARAFSFGEVSAGLGIESVDDKISDTTSSDTRFFLQWRSSY